MLELLMLIVRLGLSLALVLAVTLGGGLMVCGASSGHGDDLIFSVGGLVLAGVACVALWAIWRRRT
jgi:hypothetical protein